MKVLLLILILLPCLLYSEEALSIAVSYYMSGPYGDASCSCKGVGGMSQLANIVMEISKRYQPLLIVDLGNFLSAKPNTPDLDMGALKMYEYLKYDAVIVGENELKDGREWIDKFYPYLKVPMLSVNITGETSANPLYMPWMITKKGNMRIGIVGISDPLRFNSELLKTQNIAVRRADDQLKSYLDRLAEKTDIIICLYYGYYSSGVEIAKKYPQFKIVIVGGKERDYKSTIVYPQKSMVIEIPAVQQVLLLNVYMDKGFITSFIPQTFYLGHVIPNHEADEIIQFYSKAPEQTVNLENSKLIKKTDWIPGNMSIEVFYSENCPHCREFLMKTLPAIIESNSLNIMYYNIDNKEDYQLLLKREKGFNTKAIDMPAIAFPTCLISGPNDCTLSNISEVISKEKASKDANTSPLTIEWMRLIPVN